MTACLEELFGGPIVIDVKAQHHDETGYRRLVVLKRADSDIPLLLGAIDVRLDLFTNRVRTAIEEAKKPFGRILDDMAVEHTFKGDVFYTLRSTGPIAELLLSPVGAVLFARRKVTLNADNVVLATVVEIPARHNRFE